MKEYNLNVRKISHKKRNRRVAIFLIIVALIALIVWIYLHFFVHPNTKIGKPITTVTKIAPASNGTQTYKASDFSFQMSPGWIQVPITSSLYNLYEWKTGSGENFQTVMVFENTIPPSYGVNRTIVVESTFNKIIVLGQPSDNCANFTYKSGTGSTANGYPAKWQNVAFFCDLNNPLRDTVGITSAANTDSVSLVSPTNVHRSFFFLYTDSNTQPSYGDFEELLTSFQLQ